MAGGFGKVFEIGPVFRANPSFTSRHDTEFTSVDVEISLDRLARGRDGLRGALARARALRRGSRARRADHEHVRRRGDGGADGAVPAHHARRRKGPAGGARPRGARPRPRPRPAERAGAVGDRRRAVTAASSSSSPTTRPRCGLFTTCAIEDRPTLTKSFDLLWRGIELTTGAQREHRYEQLLAQAHEKEVEVEPIQYYLDFFRYGAPPHGGFGFGLTRLLMQMLGQDNVREVTFLYRGPNRLEP